MIRKTLYALALLFVVAQATNKLTLQGTIRDFTPATNPDFEYTIATELGIVKTQLGGDKKPVYAGDPKNTVHSQTTFDQWYRDTSGVNLAMPYSIDLTDDDNDGIYTYENNAFFPIDGQLFGNYDGFGHNYHFTFEVHSTFTYETGQHFNFIGDDDVWVFINDQLVVDLGGVHGAISGSIDLDTLGLTANQDYTFDFFFAERHTTESHFKIETSIKLIPAPLCPVYPEQQAVYQWYKSSINDHFYTADPKGEIAQVSGYTGVHIAFYTLVYPSANPATKPIYRLWSGALAQHVYTTSSTERATLLAGPGGYADEGVTGYIYANQEPGTVALSRYTSNADGKNFYSRYGTAAPAGYTLLEVMGYIY